MTFSGYPNVRNKGLYGLRGLMQPKAELNDSNEAFSLKLLTPQSNNKAESSIKSVRFSKTRNP